MSEALTDRIEALSKNFRYAYRRHYLRKQLRRDGNYKNALTAEQRRQAKAYWGKYTKHFSPLWHEIFTARIGKFDVRYVPVDIMFTEIEGSFNDWECAHGIDNKNNYSMYFPEVRQPKSVFRKMRGIYHDDDYNIISEEQAIQNCIRNGDVIFKVALESGKGGGISFWRTVDGEEKLRAMVRTFPMDLNAQEVIAQHPTLAAINPSSVNIIRVITFATKDEIVKIATYLQLGRDKTRQSQVAVGGVCVSILPDGTLCKYAVDSKYERSTQHPCGLTYEGFQVPSYDAVCQAAINLHKKMGNFRIISWDFAVSPEGEPVFIETNLKYGGIMFHQMSSGPLFGDKTEYMLEEAFGV